MLVDCAHYVRGIRQHQGPMTLDEAAARPRRGASFVWLELHEPGAELMAELRARFGLHELAVEDAARAHQRPKVEAYDSSTSSCSAPHGTTHAASGWSSARSTCSSVPITRSRCAMGMPAT